MMNIRDTIENGSTCLRQSVDYDNTIISMLEQLSPPRNDGPSKPLVRKNYHFF